MSKINKIMVAAVIAVFTLTGAVQAQQLTVKGTVRDAKTGEALPLVNVGLMRSTDTVFVRGNSSDSAGRCEIKEGKPGQ